MKANLPRIFKLTIVVAIMLGGAGYLHTWVAKVSPREGGISPAKTVTASAAEVAGEKTNPIPTSVSPVASTRQPPSSLSSAPVKQPNVFGLSGAVQLEDVPKGPFHDELSRLSALARRAALDELGRLQIPLHDVESLSVDSDGKMFYHCSPPKLPPATLVATDVQSDVSALSADALEPTVAAAEVSIVIPPVRHSRPGATKVIYLDFNGHTITGTAWNSAQGVYEAKPFDIDGNPTSFSETEQTVIIQVWERVSEDYRGFDVDVTTEEPATFTSTTGRVLITSNVDANGNNMPSSSSAGVAYVSVFGNFNYVSQYSPALVYANQVSNREDYIAEVASHEMGHNLSLSHDGTAAVAGDNYYAGHGSGETSWNSLMGLASARNKTQWSKGDYYDADNFQDDLALIAGRLGYIPDDYTDSNATATPLTVNGLNVSAAGIISQTGDADRFSFESGAGAISISGSGFRSALHTHGGDLDVALELYDSGGSLVASANVDGVTNATLNTTVIGGTYYLRVFGASGGSPLSSSPTGYTNYGSLGQYTITGTIVSTVPVAPTIISQPANQTVYVGQAAQFTVAANGYPAPTYQWQKGGVNVSGANGSTYSISSAQAGDAGSYTCVATNASGSATSNAATLTVTTPTLPSFTSQPSNQTVTQGGSVTFTAAASGTPAPTLQWQKGGVNISGATNSTYTIATVSTGSAGSYRVVATNLAGSTNSNAATLTVNAATLPVFSTQPVSQVIAIGAPVTFTAVAGALPAPTYQWKKAGVNISGATGSSYTIASVVAGSVGSYTVVATNLAGSVTSNAAALTLVVAPSGAIISFTVQ